jgi:hypothetical protein
VLQQHIRGVIEQPAGGNPVLGHAATTDRSADCLRGPIRGDGALWQRRVEVGDSINQMIAQFAEGSWWEIQGCGWRG